MKCGNCRFWVEFDRVFENDPDLRVGNCKRFPPQYDHAAANEQVGFEEAQTFLGAWAFPCTASGDRCGEWDQA